MSRLLIPVLLSALVWPGTGQLYNRDFKKGFTLISLTLLFGATLFIKVGSLIVHRLPTDASTLDAAALHAITESALRENPAFMSTFNFLVLATWFFSIVDAYWGARERNAPPPPREDDVSDA
jgi:hypothetical protein